MKKYLFSAAIAALAMSSCSNDENLGQAQLEDGAIAFDIYTARTATRALTPKEAQSIDTKVLQASTEGFGVYAFETGSQKFGSYLANNTYPQFMFNQQVKWSSTEAEGSNDFYTKGEWKYTPVKYWPNDDSYVTFQAYAPWQQGKEVLYDVKYNGVGIRYGVDEAYDLLWGANDATGGKFCFYDQKKPSVTDRTKFHFFHALSKVDFTVSYNADELCNTSANKLDENTKIVVRSIKLLGTLPSQGVLSLYDGSWTVEKVSENKFEYDTDFFGFKNNYGTYGGEELANAGVLTPDVKKIYANKSVMLIPGETDVKLEISYDVVTTDPAGNNSHTKNITIVSDKIPTHWGNSHAGDTGVDYFNPDGTVNPNTPGAGLDDKPGIFRFDAGKWTTIDIHLGMTSVKLAATVEDWVTSESGAIDMPANRDFVVVENVAGIASAIADGKTDIEVLNAPTSPATIQVPKKFGEENNATFKLKLPETAVDVTIKYDDQTDKAPAKLDLEIPMTGSATLTINTPDSHVTLNGEYYDVDASTSSTTFVLPAESKINGTLTVKEGGVELYGSVNALKVSPATGKTVAFRDCVGLSPAVYNVAKKYIAPGYIEKQNADGTWNIVQSNMKVDPAGIYHCASAKALVEFAELVNSNASTFEKKTIVLDNDIDLAGIDWKPIGNVTSYPGVTFKGTFDGQNHTISNLTASDFLPDYASAGLFGSVIGTIKNVKVENATITSSHYAGVICGFSSTNGCTIENCHVKNATVTSTPELLGSEYDNGDKAGGILGYMVKGDVVTGCSVEDVTVKAYRDLGAVVGCADYGAAAGVTNNTAKNCTVIQCNKNGYKSEKISTYGEIIGRHGNDVPDSNKAENVTLKSVEE